LIPQTHASHLEEEEARFFNVRFDSPDKYKPFGRRGSQIL